MEIKVKSVKAKEASVNISVDAKSAEVLKVYLEMTYENAGNLIDTISEVTEFSPCDITELIMGIANGLDGE